MSSFAFALDLWSGAFKIPSSLGYEGNFGEEDIEAVEVEVVFPDLLKLLYSPLLFRYETCGGFSMLIDSPKALKRNFSEPRCALSMTGQIVASRAGLILMDKLRQTTSPLSRSAALTRLPSIDGRSSSHQAFSSM